PGEGSCREPEESRNPAEKSGSPAVPENCSTSECLANPTAAVRDPGPLPCCFSLTFIAAPALTAPIPLEAAVPQDLSQLPPAPSCPDQNQFPSPLPTAADTEVGIPMEVPEPEVTVEKLIMPVTSSKGVEKKGLEEKDVKDSGNAGQGPVANVPEGPGKVDSGPEKPEKGSCVGRPAACQRHATRKFYSCPICSKSFLLKINFLIHQHSHSNSAPYSCVHCDRKFMSKKKIKWHLQAWAASGTCQPSEPEPCPGRTPCPTSQPQTQLASGTCQPPAAQVCPRQTLCQTSQPQTWAANRTCQPLDA
ncbi:ZN777 protein, partial [Mionectes macconnelli]|nr:ZN777 protein [Mionectes macconnelli]